MLLDLSGMAGKVINQQSGKLDFSPTYCWFVKTSSSTLSALKYRSQTLNALKNWFQLGTILLKKQQSGHP